MDARTFEVAATQAERRRAGRAWTPTAVEVAEDELSPDQWTALLEDPAIVVTGDGTPFDLEVGGVDEDVQRRLNRALWYEDRAEGKVRHCRQRLHDAVEKVREAAADADAARREAGETLPERRPEGWVERLLGPVEVDAQDLEDAQARVAELEGELAGRDARIAELEAALAVRTDTPPEGPVDAEPGATGAEQGHGEAGAGDPADGVAPTSAGEAPSGRERAIRAAIELLDPANDDHWTKKDRRPDLRALREAAGLQDISSAERDAAWAALRPAAE